MKKVMLSIIIIFVVAGCSSSNPNGISIENDGQKKAIEHINECFIKCGSSYVVKTFKYGREFTECKDIKYSYGSTEISQSDRLNGIEYAGYIEAAMQPPCRNYSGGWTEWKETASPVGSPFLRIDYRKKNNNDIEFKPSYDYAKMSCYDVPLSKDNMTLDSKPINYTCSGGKAFNITFIKAKEKNDNRTQAYLIFTGSDDKWVLWSNKTMDGCYGDITCYSNNSYMFKKDIKGNVILVDLNPGRPIITRGGISDNEYICHEGR